MATIISFSANYPKNRFLLVAVLAIGRFIGGLGSMMFVGRLRSQMVDCWVQKESN
jgi:hypothetical protein